MGKGSRRSSAAGGWGSEGAEGRAALGRRVGARLVGRGRAKRGAQPGGLGRSFGIPGQQDAGERWVAIATGGGRAARGGRGGGGMAEGIPACELLYDTSLLLQFCNGEWKRRCSPSSAVSRPAAPGSLGRGPARAEEPPHEGRASGFRAGVFAAWPRRAKRGQGHWGRQGGIRGKGCPAPGKARSPVPPQAGGEPRPAAPPSDPLPGFRKGPEGRGERGSTHHSDRNGRAQNSELPQGRSAGREGQEGDPPPPATTCLCSEGVCFSPTCQAGLGWRQPPGIIEGHLGINPAPSSALGGRPAGKGSGPRPGDNPNPGQLPSCRHLEPPSPCRSISGQQLPLPPVHPMAGTLPGCRTSL